MNNSPIMKDVTEHWNTAAPEWDSLLSDPKSFPNHAESFRRFHWFMKRSLKIGNRTKTYRLLDLGCGTGEASWPLWKRVASVTFFDISQTMLRRVRNKYDKGIFVCGDAADPPFIDAEFDVIISRGAVISQVPPGGIPDFLKHTWRVLRTHGFLLFDFVCNADAWPGQSSLYRSSWTRSEMKSLLEAHLPSAQILAWDGTENQPLNRVLLKK